MPNSPTATFTFEGRRYYVRGKTKTDAIQKAALKKAELKAGAVAASNKTVKEWWDEYLEVYKTRASAKTLELYKGIYKKAIAPWIGQRALKSVRSADLQRLLNDLSDKSPSYANKTKILLTGLFRTAVENDLIPRSPAVGLRLPETKPAGERRALTTAERTIFLNAAARSGKPGLFFLVIYYCGLRPSEVCRIRYEDIDRKARVLHVRGTKTKAATRDVPIPLALEIPEGSGQMFTNARSSGEPTKKAQQFWWKKVTAEMAKILAENSESVAEDLTPYCLRHDYCTRLQEAGVPIDVARRLMGHSSIEVTSKIYTHASDVTLEAARALIDKGAVGVAVGGEASKS